MTEQQRRDAIAACDRITAANDRLQIIAADITRGCEEMRALWPAQDGQEQCDIMRAAMKRLNESGTGEMGLLDTIHATHEILRSGLPK